MTSSEIKQLQRELNAFVKKYLKGVNPVQVDGLYGHASKRRVMTCKFYLGYGRHRNADVRELFRLRLRHPHSKVHSPDSIRKTGAARRKRQREDWEREHRENKDVSSVDGVPVAKWIKPWLLKSRAAGWKGKVNSGYRSPEYSDSLCRRMCGRPSCPGRCAGRASNHSGKIYPHGAVDVSDYSNFEHIQGRIGSPLVNRLDARDPVHFSVSGR